MISFTRRLPSVRVLTGLLLIAVAGAPFALAAVPGTAGVLKTEFIFETAPYPSCHAATIAEASPGHLVAAWFGGTAERNPDVGIWVSRHEGGRWLEAVEVANGVQADGTRQPTWNPVLFQPPSGDLHLFYKVGPSPSAWWGMVMTSADGGLTWSKPVRLPTGIEGPAKNKPIVLPDGTWLSGISTEGGKWTARVERSRDQGKTWTQSAPLNDHTVIRTIQPTLVRHTDGGIQMLCRTQEGKISETWSSDGGETWGPTSLLNVPNNNSGLDAVALKDGRTLLVYNHSGREEAGMGHKGRGILNVAVSRDGKAWDAALVLDYLDAPERQFSYPSVIQASDGRVHIVYTWHRERIKHVVVDPAALEPVAIVDGRWPNALTGGLPVPPR
jgi:alpha-L-rhamnosidase